MRQMFYKPDATVLNKIIDSIKAMNEKTSGTYRHNF